MFRRSIAAIALLSAIALWGTAPGAFAQAPIESGVDVGIRPGDDFHAFANGAWLKDTEIPAGRERWAVSNQLGEQTRQQISQLLTDANSAPPGSNARKLADFRVAYLNEAAIEAKGLAPLKPLLDRIERVRDKAALTQLLGRQLRADVDPMNLGVYDSSQLVGLAVQASIHGEKTNVAFLLQGGLGLPEREHYLGTEPKMQALRTQYVQTIGHLLALAGFDRAAQRAQAVMALEVAIAQSHATPEASSLERNADNVWTRAEFSRQAPGMDWHSFFAAAGLAKQPTFVAWQPSAMKGVAALLAAQPLQVWKDYLRVRALLIHADVLPQAFADEALALNAAASGKPPSSRSQRALDATQSALSEALGRLYAERHFPAEHKASVQAIVAHVVTAFAQRVQAVTWMSPSAKKTALAKLKSLYFGVGYPETWQDFSDLAIDPADAFGNQERVAERHRRQALARLGKNIDRTEWAIAPQRPGAVLLFNQNAYNFAAALLQAPKFDADASAAANYGAIGAIVGHEISHFVDTLGAEYEADGRLRRWWTAQDMSGYEGATAALVNQFSAYRPLPDLAPELSIDGKLTLVENLADLGGLAAAFDAYRATLGNQANDGAYVRQQDRQFFIGYARAWRGKMSERGLRVYVAGDNHAPETFRIATVRNLDAWYEAFDVLPGQRLYLAPAARVRIW